MAKRRTFKTADGVTLEYEVAGEGSPVLWQHGLGAPFTQPAAVFPDDEDLQRITLACRGHEGSELGDPLHLTFQTFANDALALLDHLGIKKAAVGGISLGAGIAMRLAADHPDRVSRLILARPAWVDQPSPKTQAAYLTVVEVLILHGMKDGLAAIQLRPEYLELAAASPDNAKSILSYFSRPRPETTVALLSRISARYPGLAKHEIAKIKTPTLIIGNGEDVVHPLAYAKALADLISGSQLQIIKSKSMDAVAYQLEFKAALAKFLLGA